MTKRKILVIDDSEVVLSRVQRVLAQQGWEVTGTTQVVGNGRHLVGCDLVVVDFHMPGIDGGEVITSLRHAAVHNGKLPLFYLFTSDETLVADFARHGFDGAFTQKGDDEALVRQVRAVFRTTDMRAKMAGRVKSESTER